MIFQRTHCLRGHPMTDDNIRMVHGKKVQRVCIACDKARRAMRKEGVKIERQPVNSCHRGHEFTVENTYWQTSGGHRQKRCRACMLEKQKKAYWKDPEKFRQSQIRTGYPARAKKRKELSDAYILTLLYNKGVSRQQARDNPEIIDALREQIRLQRLVKHLKSQNQITQDHGQGS